uniref:UvrD-helicase domain-containing protein n=1 Tax=Herbidospora sakaeratensis TaxID=564415 RepID=UPI00078159DE|nr:UvrD-helicase domain-containing protein [Herbidospora sakaeratensis]
MTFTFSQPGGAPAAPAAPVYEVPPTPEQQAIIDAAATGADLTITAGAGTGKTTTLKMLGQHTRGRGLYVAYNRAIADEARASFPPNVHCSTAHGLAFAAVGKKFQHRLNGARQPARVVAQLLAIPAVLHIGDTGLTAAKVARLVSDTIARFCWSAADQIGWDHVPDVPGLDTPALRTELRTAIVPIAVRAWADIRDEKGGVLRFTHDHYLKLWALTNPALPYNLVMLDEAQDANPVIASVINGQSAQRILVGDSSQAIYGWRGAVDAMSGFNGQRLALTQSWRFGQRIAEEANHWLGLLDAPLRLTGNPGRDSRLAPLAQADAILCRSNAGAVSHAMAAQAAGHPTALVGGGTDIRMLAEAARDLQAGRSVHHPELMAFSSWSEVQEYAEHDAGGADLKTFVKLIDSLGVNRVLGVLSSLVDEYNARVIVSTAHKAKGREWGTVQLASDFGDIYDPQTGELRTTEVMLTYVAVTRGKDVLDRTMLGTGGGQPAIPGLGQAAAPTSISTLPQPAALAAPTAPEDDDAIELPAEARNWLTEIKEAAAEEAAAKARKERAEEQLQAMVGDHHAATLDGRPAITWKPSAVSYSVDSKGLREEHPEIWAKFAKPKKQARPFKLAGEWK